MAQSVVKPSRTAAMQKGFLKKNLIWLLAVGLIILIFIWRALTGTQPLVDTFTVIFFTLSFSTPIALGALSGTFCERSGVVNIAIEGMMLSGAYFGALLTAITGQLVLGVIAAMLAGGFLASIHSLLSIFFRVDQIISGTVINIFAFGLTNYLHILTQKKADVTSGKLPGFTVDIGGASFSLGMITIISVLAVFAGHYLLFNTTWGLRTRAVGENPKAADTAGVNVFKVRYINVICAGLLAGLAGTYFSLQVLGGFTEGMTVGTGFIALAAMIFGNWKPLNAWGAALLFGLCITADNVLQSWYGTISWLHTITQSIPYVVTIVVVAGFIGRSRPPAAVGTPYVKQ